MTRYVHYYRKDYGGGVHRAIVTDSNGQIDWEFSVVFSNGHSVPMCVGGSSTVHLAFERCDDYYEKCVKVIGND